MPIQKIFLGTMEIANQLHLWGETLKQMGYEVETHLVGKNPFYDDSSVTGYLNHNGNLQLLTELQQNPIATVLARHTQLSHVARLLTHFDLYVFQFAHSIVGNLAELDILRSLGKKIICVFNGSDVREDSAYRLYCRMNNVAAIPAGSDKTLAPLNVRLRYIRTAELYADAIICTPVNHCLAVAPYFHFHQIVDPSCITANVPDRDVPVVVHAPSHRGVKGTEEILAALTDLRSEGLQFEVVLLEGRSNREVLDILTDADICIDQLYSEYPATLAIEAMAAGCAVACGNRSDTMPFPPDRPALHVEPKNVKQQLRRLITDRSLRRNLAERGPRFVQAYHHPLISVGKILDTIKRAEQADFDYHPDLFVRHYEPSAEGPVSEANRQLNHEVIKRHFDITPDLQESLRARGLI